MIVGLSRIGQNLIGISQCRGRMQLLTKPSNSKQQVENARAMISAPVPDGVRFERVFENEIYALKGQYALRD